ncbi:unnamed protein product [Orchesella dallaii]|uniref:Uncharacterized protein n=1 Tax=Orchesella dallaii TaxID=48710 RepID=A0ABP1S6S1_9HEXA
MGVTLDESMVVSKIVSSLNDERHGAFKKAWDSVAADNQTMANLHARLKKEELEIKQRDHKESTQSAAFIANFKPRQGNGNRIGGSHNNGNSNGNYSNSNHRYQGKNRSGNANNSNYGNHGNGNGNSNGRKPFGKKLVVEMKANSRCNKTFTKSE